MSAAVVKARDELRWAREALSNAVRQAFPIGKIIIYVRGRASLQTGVVTAHGYDDRLKVRNVATRAEYWICSSYIQGCQQ